MLALGGTWPPPLNQPCFRGGALVVEVPVLPAALSLLKLQLQGSLLLPDKFPAQMLLPTFNVYSSTIPICSGDVLLLSFIHVSAERSSSQPGDLTYF